MRNGIPTRPSSSGTISTLCISELQQGLGPCHLHDHFLSVALALSWPMMPNLHPYLSKLFYIRLNLPEALRQAPIVWRVDTAQVHARSLW